MTEAPPSESEWRSQINSARRQGDNLRAFDLSMQALAAWRDALSFDYQAILALARAGALSAARSRYDTLVASGRLETIADPCLAADFAALDGRLWKNLAARSFDAPRLHLKAAAAYESAFRRFGGFFPAINAAAMFLAADHAEEARCYAGIAQNLATVAPSSYWSCVTQAEAALILGDFPAAIRRLQDANAFGIGNLDELATTRRQLGWIAVLVSAPPETLAALAGPRVLSWLTDAAPDVRAAAGTELTPEEQVVAFGPLLEPSDVAIAQALLARGAELHLVLPCEPQLLLGAGLLDAAPAVFEALLAAARSVMLVTGEGSPREPAARLLCQQQARGLAILRGDSLAVSAEHCSLGDGGLFVRSMAEADGGIQETAASWAGPAEMARQPRAILFGDVRGFSRLNEAEQLLFLTHVIGGFAGILERYPAKDYAETAGDGLYVVFSDVVAAAECCFDLQKALTPDRIAEAGLPPHLGLRLSAHVGPLYRRFDPVIARDKFCGMEVIRTARIEPVTPVGEIFVTEHFAATLAFAANDRFICEYAGLQPMAKGFGACRMYSLQRLFNETGVTA
jgi:class 3 adenylate cyclase